MEKWDKNLVYLFLPGAIITNQNDEVIALTDSQHKIMLKCNKEKIY